MIFKDIYLIVFLIISACLIGCSSGEYDLEQTQVEYVEKTLKYDTLQTVIRDTIEKKEDLVINNSKESFTFIVQIGAFREINNFQRFYDEAKIKLGEGLYNAFINNLYKIRIGNYNNKADALKMLEYVKSLGYYDAFIVTVINK